MTAVPRQEGLDAPLERGLGELRLDLPQEVRAKLVRYVQLLDKWNHTYNLTAVREPAQMITRHILDSLAVLPFVNGPRVIDVGTGAGLPGIPLALARPDWHVALLDSNAKKTQFVTQAIAELGIPNAEVVRERVERHQPESPFDTVVSRAFASLAEMLQGTGHLAAKGGRWVAMKGVYPQEEIAAVPPEYHVQKIEAVQVPGLDAARHVVIVTRQEEAHG